MTDSRAAFRLGLAPVLLLGFNIASGNPLPFLAPSLAVTLLVASRRRPPLRNLAAALVLVVGLTWSLDHLFALVSDSPISAWLVFLALTTAAFARLAQRPGNMPAMLTLICASIVVVIRHWAQGLDLSVTSVMGWAVVQAIVATLLAHAVLPSVTPAVAAPRPGSIGQGDILQVFGRSIALLGALGFALLQEDNSAILVALTAVNILALPAWSAAQRQGHALLIGNAVAAAMIVPLIMVAALRPDLVLLVLLALAAALWMAKGLDGDGTRRVIAQAGLPVFVILLGVVLPKAGDTALPVLTDRLLTLGLVMLYAIAVLALLTPRPAEALPSPSA
ncbi:DUF2955 domain-containing protein [Acidisoma cellulosilytica]|uniref:DUF2955 domain-containing protein n=1 Tax=Acidisoma cellulosilyticum TaxID=2802395 RepID=A0A963YYG6_9PROT|nr:hypothetical protein [Acidisoma cellulosilyticum]MCB8879454.1 DUF2955 domain-containing protein [Acidisoma cellulosilyticum]